MDTRREIETMEKREEVRRRRGERTLDRKRK